MEIRGQFLLKYYGLLRSFYIHFAIESYGAQNEAYMSRSTEK